MKESDKSPLFQLVMAILVTLALAQLVLPWRWNSTLENRPLAQKPKTSVQSVLSGRWMKEMEAYVEDQFPGRDQWMMLQALWDAAQLRNERNGVLLGYDGWLFERMDHLKTQTAEDNIQALVDLAKGRDIPFTLMLVPTSAAVYKHYLPADYQPDAQMELIDELYAKAEGWESIQLVPRMYFSAAFEGMLADAYPLYLHTDHHWSYDGAKLAYEMWREAKGMPGAAELDEPLVVSGLKGTYFSRAPSPLIQGETFAYDAPLDSMYLARSDDTPLGDVHDTIMIRSSSVKDKYAHLLHGNEGMMKLYNDAVDGGSLLLIKDSYANAIVTMLGRHYRCITIIDPRYFTGWSLSTLIDRLEVDEVLCLYGLTTFISDRNLMLLSGD